MFSYLLVYWLKMKSLKFKRSIEEFSLNQQKLGSILSQDSGKKKVESNSYKFKYFPSFHLKPFCHGNNNSVYKIPHPSVYLRDLGLFSK
jgi:hypothetical protein